ncbi:hypothetical protein B0T16DRAFT_513668 [Cercophora newfieldiana]|uniref:Uncharacterized protein n=1 Tax=Cercophora newfieldiana TaxID=92897 RepID=A0AA40CMW2_9PEZI|nr:hypothetical protein B0T16DRAFT_513668 [Cercophora newfieldiana]
MKYWTYLPGGSQPTSSSGGSTSSPTVSASVAPSSSSSFTPSPSSIESSSSTISASPSPTCAPLFSLEGASENAFNPANAPFSLSLSCGTLDTANYTVFANDESSTEAFGTLVQGTTATEKSITIPGFSPGKISITLAAVDTAGIPIFQSFSLLFGSVTMPVLILDENGAPIIVDKIGDLTCDQCGSCETCPGDPMCQAMCKEPPLQSCAFYSECAEATLRCGGGGYPLRYGRKNCLAFQSDLAKYSAAGQTFIWNTMHCLQVALRDAINCDSTCGQVNDAAFDSHPTCYVNSGFCDLPPGDVWQLIKTVNMDLVGTQSIKQILQTGGACVSQIVVKIEDAITAYLEQAVSDIANAAVHLAKAAAMGILKKLIQDLLDGSYPLPNV